MNKIKSIILASALLCAMSSTSKAGLTDILQKYCVPTSASNCTGISRATYNGSSCECGACNMYYNKGTRTCQTCATGTYVTNRSSTECIRPTCSTDQYSETVAGGNTCPSGYYRVTLSTCK